MPELSIYDATDPSTSSKAMEQSLRLADPPTAVIGMNHGVSIGILNTLMRQAPKMSFIGVDEFELSDALGINVIDCRPEELGRLAARVAIDRIKTPQLPTVTVSLTPNLVIRTPL